jgi:FemAB-related protein (PEP-CTERM system-associated)
MNARLYTDADRDQWDRYVMKTGSASCYHLSAWKGVVEKSFGHRTYYILVQNKENEVGGIFPLVRLKSLIFGNFMVSLPYFNYGGICADGDESRYLLMRKAVELAREEGARHIEMRHTYPMNGVPVKTEKVSMRLELPKKSEDLWKSFPSKLRSQVRRPSKEGMYATIGREDELDNFYAVFAGNMRDLGTPVYAKTFFENILSAYPAACICTVYTRERQPAASGFLIGFKESLEIPWASSLKRYNRQSPNMLLYWTALTYGCEEGYGWFDFGRSTAGESTCRFKEQWGARPTQLYWHYWMKTGTSMPQLNPNNPKYRAAITLWKRLPLHLTKLIGPSIVKNLP